MLRGLSTGLDYNTIVTSHYRNQTVVEDDAQALFTAYARVVETHRVYRYSEGKQPLQMCG